MKQQETSIQDQSAAALVEMHRSLNSLSGAKAHRVTIQDKKRKLQLKDEIARRADAGCAVCDEYLGRHGANVSQPQAKRLPLRLAATSEQTESDDEGRRSVGSRAA